MTDALRLEHIAKVHGTGETAVRALSDVSLTIKPGDFVAIVGESGSGKSTLIGILGLLDLPSSGSYTFDGQPIQVSRLPEHRSEHFSQVFQSFHLLDHRPAVHSAGLALLYRGLRWDEIQSRSREAMTSLGLGERLEVKGGRLSGGERQRVAIARALASRTPYLIADEPTGNLDSLNSERVLQAIEHAHSEGCAVILVTHSNAIAQRAERIIEISDGLVVNDSGESALPRVAAPKPPGRQSRVHALSMLRDIWHNTVSRGARLVGYTAAVALAVALVIVTLGLSNSAAHQVASDFDVVSSREVTVVRLLDDATLPLSTATLDQLSSLNGVQAVADSIETAGSVGRASSDTSIDVPIFTVRGDIAGAGRLRLSDGSTVGEAGVARGEALLGSAIAARLEIGDVTVDTNVVIGNHAYLVTGIIEESPREPSWTGAVLIAPVDSTETVIGENRTLLTTGVGAARQVAQEVGLVLQPADPEKLDVVVPPDPSAMRQSVEASVATTLTLLTLTTLVGSVVAITLSSLAAASERRVEFGLRRAVGARASHLLVMLAGEAAIYGTIGSAAGAVAGVGTLIAVTIANRWAPIFDPALLALAVLVGISVAVAGSFAGAIRALRIAPGTALRPS